jgi:hypothetical protein
VYTFHVFVYRCYDASDRLGGVGEVHRQSCAHVLALAIWRPLFEVLFEIPFFSIGSRLSNQTRKCFRDIRFRFPPPAFESNPSVLPRHCQSRDVLM